MNNSDKLCFGVETKYKFYSVIGWGQLNSNGFWLVKHINIYEVHGD